MYTCILCAKLLQSFPSLCDPRTVTCQAPQSMEFSRQEYRSILARPSSRGSSPPRDLLHLGSPVLGGVSSLPVPSGKPILYTYIHIYTHT